MFLLLFGDYGTVTSASNISCEGAERGNRECTVIAIHIEMHPCVFLNVQQPDLSRSLLGDGFVPLQKNRGLM